MNYGGGGIGIGPDFHNIHQYDPSRYNGGGGAVPAGYHESLNLVAAISMRMRWLGNVHPFSFLAAAQFDREGAKYVAVFLITAEGPLTLEDNWDLFPSDALITQLRLIV